MNSAIIQRYVLLKCRNNINFNVYRKVSSTWLSPSNKTVLKSKQPVKLNTAFVSKNFLHDNNVSCAKNTTNSIDKIQDSYTTLQLKRRPAKRKKIISDDEATTGIWYVKALATAEEYDLEALMQGLKEQNLYVPHIISMPTSSLPDVIHAVAKYEVEHEPREIFFFREGSVVMWNISDLESGNLLQYLQRYGENRYTDDIVQSECEIMTYSYTDTGKFSHLKDGNFMLTPNATNLDKYTFSNAMAQSVKLGIWEATLDIYIDSIEFVTEDLKAGRKLKMTQQKALRKQGELFALRHSINLSSDLLDTPDFYWERDDLEVLYQQTCAYFSIAKRTRVINEKLNHCVELIGIVSSHLSDRHHIRLEWMIIILIMVEVAFETLHYIDRYFSQ